MEIYKAAYKKTERCCGNCKLKRNGKSSNNCKHPDTQHLLNHEFLIDSNLCDGHRWDKPPRGIRSIRSL